MLFTVDPEHVTLFSSSMGNRPSSGERDGAVRGFVAARADLVGLTVCVASDINNP
jgi:hypothetical protein